MAKLFGTVNMRADRYFTDARVCLCMIVNCNHNMAYKMGKAGGDLVCHFRMIEIDKDGKCLQFEKKEEGHENQETG